MHNASIHLRESHSRRSVFRDRTGWKKQGGELTLRGRSVIGAGAVLSRSVPRMRDPVQQFAPSQQAGLDSRLAKMRSDDSPLSVPAQAGTHTPQQAMAGPAMTETLVVMVPHSRPCENSGFLLLWTLRCCWQLQEDLSHARGCLKRFQQRRYSQDGHDPLEM